LAAVKAHRAEWAAKFDNGDITFGQLQAELDKLNDAEHAIRESLIVSKVGRPAPTPAASNDLYLEALTADLETKHPNVLRFADETDFEFLVTKARQSLEAKGIPIDNTPQGKYTLRREVAEQADIWGPRIYGPLSGQGQPTPPAPSAAAAARAGKLDMAANAPPDLSSMPGTGIGQPGDYSAAQIEAMTEDEIMLLPAATRAKILGTTSL
jgi:hypothetical protein